ncbi:MAG: PAS domain S-box protein [Oculatellaceae cyanobacterium bins.114]|nr:PAS domain S-box protein [Oculatellaceae cyanobacterium bins.114]
MSTRRTVLVIAGSEQSVDRYERQLQQDGSFAYQVLTEQYDTQLSLLSRSQPIDGILLELHSPHSTSFDILRQLKEQMSDRCPPIVVVDGEDAEMAVRAFKSGAVDYLVKDRMTPDDLRGAMRSAIANAELRHQLQRSQEQFQTSVENMLDCFGIFSSIRDQSGQIVDFRIDYLNEAACQNNQLPKAVQIGRGLCEVLPAHRASGLFDEYRQLVETGKPLIKDALIYDDTYGEQRLIRAFDIRATRLNDGFVASWRDVTDRKRLELELSKTATALHSSQQRYQDLAEAMPQIVWMADATGAANYWNQRWYDYTGLSVAESMGLAGANTVHPDERDRTLAHWSQSIVTGQPFEIEYRIRRWDGEYHWFICRALPTFTDQQVITGWIGTITDIDNQKQLEARLLSAIANHERTEQVLRATNQQVTCILESMTDAYVALDRDWCITYVNQITARLNQTSPEDLVGKSHWDVWPATKGTICEEQYRWAIAHQTPAHFDYFYEAKQRWYEVHAYPSADGLGIYYRDIHDRKCTEQALQDSEERFRLVTHAVNGLIFDWNVQADEVYRSEKLFDLVGVDPADAPPTAVWWQERLHPDDAAQLQLRLPEVLSQSNGLYEEEYRVRHADGRWIDVWERGCFIRDEQGQIVRVVGSTVDISDRKRTEARLRDSQAQLQQQLAEIEAIYQSAPIGLSILDADLRFVRINQRLADMNGLPVEAHIGRTVRELLPDLADAAEQILRPILETGEPLLNVKIQGETPAQPGVKRTWLEHFLPLKSEQSQRVIGISTVCEEITERIQVEAALRQSEERFRNMADNAPMMVWVVDETGYCTYLSQSWYEFTGQTEATGLGFGWLEAVHPGDRDFSKQIFLAASERHEAFRLEYRLRHQNGDYRWAIDAAAPWFGEDGEFRGYIGSVVDIHDRKQTEDALRQSEERYRTLFESMNEGFCVIEMLFDDQDTPLDYRFLELNPAFEHQTGLSQAEGKTARQLMPDLEPYWFETYGKVALTGEPVRFENGSDTLNRWFDVSAFRIGEAGSRKVAILFKDTSDRKQAARELSESEARFRTLADNISQLAWMTNELGWIFWYNQRWFDYTGTTLEEMQGWGWQQVQHPDHVERVVSKFRRCIETGETWEDTFPLRGRDGHYRWFLSRAIPIRDEQGKVLRWFGTNTDITDLRQTEMALQQATERLNIALKSAPLTLFNQDRELRYTWIYNPTQNFLVEEVIGQRDEDLVSLESAAHLTRLKQQVLDTGVGLREEVEITKNGKTAYYDLTVDPIRDSQDRVVGITCAAVDITDRKQAEEALRQSEDRFRIAIESARLGTWDLNLTTNELVWDDGCKAMFGLPPHAKSSMEVFFSGLHPADRDRLEQIVQRVLNPTSGGSYDEEYRTIGVQDGVERWIRAKGQAYFDSNGTPRRFIGTVLDITEQKRAEAQREQLLQQEQAAREEAERANRIKDEFLAILSHELRSPLNPILGWSKLLQTRKLDVAKTAEALATIERNAKLQTQLIDDLLDVAKILRGKLSLSVASVNLTSVIEAAMETVRTATLAKGISLHAVLPHVGEVAGDAARLQQVVWNLLSNAIKFTAVGGRVEVRLERVEGRRVDERGEGVSLPIDPSTSPPVYAYAQITVTDTGKGINPDFLPHIFESFRQEDASTTRKYGGLGLGLAIVRQLVEAHGGTITAESAGEGKGATFTVRLPLLRSETMRDYPVAIAPPDALALPSLQFPLESIRVLAVDDEADARELLTVLLTQYGAEVLTVTSAAEVLANLESFRPDVLVSDIGMPGVDGYTLIQQIRALPAAQGGKTPAIALTAYAREGDHQRAIASGYQRHVTKPLEIEQLVESVMALVKSGTS